MKYAKLINVMSTCSNIRGKKRTGPTFAGGSSQIHLNCTQQKTAWALCVSCIIFGLGSSFVAGKTLNAQERCWRGGARADKCSRLHCPATQVCKQTVRWLRALASISCRIFDKIYAHCVHCEAEASIYVRFECIQGSLRRSQGIPWHSSFEFWGSMKSMCSCGEVFVCNSAQPTSHNDVSILSSTWGLYCVFIAMIAAIAAHQEI